MVVMHGYTTVSEQKVGFFDSAVIIKSYLEQSEKKRSLILT